MLKQDPLWRYLIEGDELKSEIERYMHYNEQRIKERLGWLSPVQAFRLGCRRM